MRAFLNNYLPLNQGEIVLQDGKVVGEHDGIQNFTIGQRKGLRVAWQEPLHVVHLDAATNQVVVAPREKAGRASCVVGAINWLSIEPPSSTINVEVQVRYRSQPVAAQLTPLKATAEDIASERPHRCKLTFNDEQFSITPGQAAVFYAADAVLGGGLIQQTTSI
jgi:tRNA-specific 2-thiouridylase